MKIIIFCLLIVMCSENIYSINYGESIYSKTIEIDHDQNFFNLPEMSVFNFSLFIQASYLIYTDIYLTTKPVLSNPHSGFIEDNFFVKPFFKFGHYDSVFFEAVALTYWFSAYLSQLDDTGYWASVFLVGLSIIEGMVITDNVRYGSKYLKEVHFQLPVIAFSF